MQRNSCIRNSQYGNWAYCEMPIVTESQYHDKGNHRQSQGRRVIEGSIAPCLPEGALGQKNAHLPWVEAERAHPYTLQLENIPHSSIKIMVIMYDQIFDFLICSFQNQYSKANCCPS